MLRGGSPEARNPIAPFTPRRYTARAVSERVEFITIDSDMLDMMLTWDQTGSYEVGELSSANEQAPASDDWMTTLLQTKAFHRIPPANIQAIFMRMQRLEAKAGDVIIKQGDDGDYFYVIVKGKCVVTRETPLNKAGIKLAELGMGDTFGEEALIADAKRNANITMLTDGALMRPGEGRFPQAAQRAHAAMGGVRSGQGARQRTAASGSTCGCRASSKTSTWKTRSTCRCISSA